MAVLIPPDEIDALKNAWQGNATDLGIGVYNPHTGEMHFGSFDTMAQGAGHQGLANGFGITDTSDWRGFVVDSNGNAVNVSHFYKPTRLKAVAH